jgi:hypothetical protein
MPKYLVWQERAFVFYQEVEATSKAQAITIADSLGEWERDDSQSDIVYHYEVELVPNQPEVDDLIKNEEESNG